MQPEELLEAVRAFADMVLNQCRDRYSDRPTPLLVDGLAVGDCEPIRWQGHVLSNPAQQRNFA